MIHAPWCGGKHPCHLCSSDLGMRKRPQLIQPLPGLPLSLVMGQFGIVPVVLTQGLTMTNGLKYP